MRIDLTNPQGRVVVVGGGRAGVAAVGHLVGLGVEPTIVDDAPSDRVVERLRSALPSSSELDAVDVRGGGIDEELLTQADLVVLSPGVPRTHPGVRAALAGGAEVVNEVELGAAMLDGYCAIAITGTNGKSTTATLLGHIARAHDATAFVGGNLGPPLTEAVAAGQRPSLLVLELSSYQLETIRSLEVQAAVVTNLSPDHLDRYPNVEAYYGAKAKLFELVKEGGGSALNRRDASSQKFLNDKTRGTRFDFDVLLGTEGVSLDHKRAEVRLGGAFDEIDLDHPYLLGRHNLENAMAALAGAALAGIPPPRWTEGLRNYQGIPHRLERVGELGGALWINDSKATNVDAAIKAVASFERGIHLIVGGRGKGASYQPLVEAARGRVERVYTIGEDGPALAAAFAGAAPVDEVETLERAMKAALGQVSNDDVVLLAPAAASFDQFESFVARGDAFRHFVKQQNEPTSSERPSMGEEEK